MLSRLLTFVRASLQRSRVSRELDEELRHHLTMEIEHHVAAGVPFEEARRRALRDLGGIEQTKEAVRDVRASWMDSWAQDLRHAVRSVWRRPAEAATVAAMLAVGVGLTTAMFTLVDALILRPVPFEQPEQLANLWMRSKTGGRITVMPAVLNGWRESGVFAGVEAANPDMAVIEVDGTFATRGMARVTPGLFAMLGGVQPVLGRLFDAADADADEPRVLLSADLWTTLYQSDPEILGKRILVNSEFVVVVGILPADFRFPVWDMQIWRADSFSLSRGTGTTLQLPRAFVRFAAGIPRDDALRVAMTTAHAADATTASQWPQAEPVVRSDPYNTRAVPVLAAGVLLVLAVLCANASSLMLARLSGRQREFAMRSALGAARSRLIRQALLEGVCVGGVAIAGGVVLAWAMVALSRGMLPEAFLVRSLNPLNIDGRTLLVTSVVGVTATLLTALLPAWLGTRVQSHASMRVNDRTSTETREARWLTRTLLVGEIALACTLLAGATMLVRTVVNMTSAERGLDTAGITVANVSVLGVVKEPSARETIMLDLARRVQSLPGVDRVSWSRGTPPNNGAFSWGDFIADGPGGRAVNLDQVNHFAVGPEFFEMLGIELRRGRNFEPGEGVESVIIGERFARLLWPDGDPLDQSFRFDKRQYRVIGVAREVEYPSLEPRLDAPEFYVPFIDVGGQVTLNIACSARCPNDGQIRHALMTAHPAVRVAGVRPLEAQFFEQLARPRAAAALATAFAVIGVVSAAGGLFSVLTFAVGRRRKEFGVRTALGASPAAIRRLVLRDGVWVTGVGLLLGSVAAALLAPTLASLQYQISATDPVSGVVVISLLGITALLACWRPAAQAVRADPVRLLRED
jgi:predicted permease